MAPIPWGPPSCANAQAGGDEGEARGPRPDAQTPSLESSGDEAPTADIARSGAEAEPSAPRSEAAEPASRQAAVVAPEPGVEDSTDNGRDETDGEGVVSDRSPRSDAWPPAEGTGDAITTHREVPNYDGRPDPGPSPEDVLLWIPRILTGPLYLVTEFVLRRPIAWLIIELEQAGVLGAAQEVFTLAGQKILILPTVFYEFGFAPSFGLYVAWDDAIFDGNRLSIHAGTFGERWLSFVAKDRIRFDDSEITIRFNARRRPDYLYGAFTSRERHEPTARFGMDQIDASIDYQVRLWRRSMIRTRFGYRSASFDNDGFFGDPSVGELVTSRGQSLPAGFTNGYSALRLEAEALLDSRPVTRRPTAGAALRVFGEGHGAFEGIPGFNAWLRWGGNAGAFTDILGDDRILSLQARVSFIHAIDGATVPFFELLDVGGKGPLRGFRSGHIRAQSSTGVELAYEWPIWVFLNGRVYFMVGGGFSESFSDFRFPDLRLAFGMGLSPTLGDDFPFEFNVAFGSETFDNGADITSVRFSIGGRNGL